MTTDVSETVTVPIPEAAHAALRDIEEKMSVLAQARHNYLSGIQVGLGFPKGVAVTVNIDAMTFSYKKE